MSSTSLTQPPHTIIIIASVFSLLRYLPSSIHGQLHCCHLSSLIVPRSGCDSDMAVASSSSAAPPIAVNSNSLTALVSACVDLSIIAGEHIRCIVADGNLGAIDKAADGDAATNIAATAEDVAMLDDPQTAADRTAHQLIVSSLRSRWPQLSVIGEEGELGTDERLVMAPKTDLLQCVHVEQQETLMALGDLDWERTCVWVDPLDGTKELTLGNYDAVTTLIGISVDGTPVAGVIHQPFGSTLPLERGLFPTIWSIVGVGAFRICDGSQSIQYNSIRNHAIPQCTTCSVVATTRSHNSVELAHVLEVTKPAQVLRIGGAGNKVLSLLDGSADAYVFPSCGTKKWDTCAGEAILRAYGGKLTDKYGHVYNYSSSVEHMNNNGVIATASKDGTALHNQFIDVCKAAATSNATA